MHKKELFPFNLSNLIKQRTISKLTSRALLSLILFNQLNIPALSINNKKEDMPGIEYLYKNPENDYIIGEGDVLKIKIARNIPELTDLHKVDSTGSVYLPKLNRIYISGLNN